MKCGIQSQCTVRMYIGTYLRSSSWFWEGGFKVHVGLYNFHPFKVENWFTVQTYIDFKFVYKLTSSSNSTSKSRELSTVRPEAASRMSYVITRGMTYIMYLSPWVLTLEGQRSVLFVSSLVGTACPYPFMSVYIVYLNLESIELVTLTVPWSLSLTFWSLNLGEARRARKDGIKYLKSSTWQPDDLPDEPYEWSRY